MALEPLLSPQTVVQYLLELLPRRPFPGCVEPGLAVQGFEQLVERLEKPPIAEIGKAGVFGGVGHQGVALELGRLDQPGPAPPSQTCVETVDKAGSPRRVNTRFGHVLRAADGSGGRRTA